MRWETFSHVRMSRDCRRQSGAKGEIMNGVLRGLLLSLCSVLFTLFGISSVYAAPPEAPPGLARAMEVHERHSRDLFSLSGVVATGVGLPGEDAPSIKVFVEEPHERWFPHSLEGLPVEIVETGRIFALRHPCGGPPSRRPWWCDESSDPVDATVRFERPVPIGVSTGHPSVTAGTICCRVRNAFDVFVLSANHIFADTNRAVFDDPVLQPGRADGGTAPQDEIGALYDFEPIMFGGAENVIDAAIALTTPEDVDNATPSDGYGVPSWITARPRPGMRVMKYGRTTGLTKGRIEAVNATVDVYYSLGIARFVRQIIVSGDGFVGGGDSGAVMVVDRGRGARRPVGLLFAGSATLAVANPINLVLKRFGVVMDDWWTHWFFGGFSWK
jgi:hypothetical protein